MDLHFDPMRLLRLLSFVLLNVLAGCAGYAPTDSMLGEPFAAILERMGAPTRVSFLQHGSQKWVYSRGPYGEHTFFLTFNAQGRLERFEQVLTDERFRTIESNMVIAEVEAILGPAKVTRQLARNRGLVASYRYENALCQWFEVEYAEDSRVRHAGYSVAPECLNDRVFRFQP